MIARIQRSLGNKELIWFGTRGDDVETVRDITNFSACYSIINRNRNAAAMRSASLEQYSGVRVDLDAHDIDEDPHAEPIDRLRLDLLKALCSPSWVFTYRPSTFLSAACFTRQGRATYLGMFKDHQAAFEHKPWVESAVATLGIPRVPWRYVADTERFTIRRLLDDGPLVIRRSHSSGGTGVAAVDTPEKLDAAWPREEEHFVSVAPFVDGGLPVNVGAVAWPDGVSVHLPSVQLIGVTGLTDRRFGYCGNDFAAAKNFDRTLLDELERSTRRVGDWMRSVGYVGAFGIDFLVAENRPLFLEVNPRFQGSTHLSSQLSRELGESCILTDHLAALLGLPHEPGPPMADLVRECPPASHFVQHWPGPDAEGVSSADLVDAYRSLSSLRRSDVLLPSDLICRQGATIARFTFADSITSTGFELSESVASVIREPERKPYGRGVLT